MLATFLLAVGVLSALVLAHEAGHLAMARLLGLRVATFSIGFGPRLAGIRAGGVEWRISLLPFGGYVRLAGASGEGHGRRSFATAPLGQRAAVVFGGPFASVVLALALLALLAATEGGLAPLAAIGAAIGSTLAALAALLGALFQLATGSLGATSLAGPVAIAQLVGDAARAGTAQLTVAAAFLSLNFAVVNLLPLPALDGGQLLFLGVEAARGRPSGAAATRWIQRFGMAALCLATAALVCHDLAQLVAR